MSTDSAIADAIRSLPEWWVIRIGISRGEASVELLDDAGESIGYGIDERDGTIAERVNAALAVAQDVVSDYGNP